MQDFQYFAPHSVDDAVGLLAENGSRARLLAGGTDILVQLRERLREADVVIDVKKIPELMEMTFSPTTGLQLGAAVPCYQFYENAEVSAAYPALADASRIIGGWQIQSRASIGGNLCNSSPAADCICPLIVHQAVCLIAGTSRRSVAAQEFCTAPGQNVLGDDEMLVALTMPPPQPRCGSAYQRFIPRNEMDIAVAGVAAWVQLDSTEQTVKQARIAVAAVAPTPRFAADASDWLAGQPAEPATYAHAGELAKQVAAPIDDMRGTAEYRTHLVGVLTRRTLATAVQRARGQQ